MKETCDTEGHEDRPGPYKIDDRRACRSCRNRHVRESDPDYTPQRPGPKPDPSKPFSRVNPTGRHFKGGATQCSGGHVFTDVSSITRSDGRRICITCVNERKGDSCKAGHLRSIHENKYGQCRECSRVAGKDRRLQAKYKLTEQELDRMIQAQDGRCALCRNVLDIESHNGVCIDHDHSCYPGQYTCGKCVRGVLCDACNKGLGSFKDSLELLDLAKRYLTTWKA